MWLFHLLWLLKPNTIAQKRFLHPSPRVFPVIISMESQHWTVRPLALCPPLTLANQEGVGQVWLSNAVTPIFLITDPHLEVTGRIGSLGICVGLCLGFASHDSVYQWLVWSSGRLLLDTCVMQRQSSHTDALWWHYVCKIFFKICCHICLLTRRNEVFKFHLKFEEIFE